MTDSAANFRSGSLASCLSRSPRRPSPITKSLSASEEWLDGQDKFDLEKVRGDSLRDMVKEFQDSSALEKASETLVSLHLYTALMELGSAPDEGLVDACSSKFLQLLRAAGRQTAERTRRDRLKFNKESKETDLVNQLAADPKKLTSILGQLRGKFAPATAPSGPSKPA